MKESQPNMQASVAAILGARHEWSSSSAGEPQSLVQRAGRKQGKALYMHASKADSACSANKAAVFSWASQKHAVCVHVMGKKSRILAKRGKAPYHSAGGFAPQLCLVQPGFCTISVTYRSAWRVLVG